MSAPVVITGAAGFVGANLVRLLASRGVPVTGLVRPGGDRWRLSELPEIAHLAECDLCDTAAMVDCFQRVRPGIVYHLATHGAYPRQQDVARMMETSCLGTANVLEAARASDVRTIVCAGSSGEYGYRDHPITEETPLEPNSYYAVGKAAAALLLQYAARVRPELQVRIVRFFSVYGEWEEPTRLLPQLALHGLDGRLPNSLGHPDSVRDFVHVEDALRALESAARCPSTEPGAVYNIGSGHQTRLQDMVALARAHFGLSETPQWNTHPKAPWDSRHWVADIGKASRELGWTPAITLETGFKRLVDWLEKNPEIRATYKHRLEVPAPSRP